MYSTVLSFHTYLSRFNVNTMRDRFFTVLHCFSFPVFRTESLKNLLCVGVSQPRTNDWGRLLRNVLDFLSTWFCIDAQEQDLQPVFAISSKRHRLKQKGDCCWVFLGFAPTTGATVWRFLVSFRCVKAIKSLAKRCLWSTISWRLYNYGVLDSSQLIRLCRINEIFLSFVWGGSSTAHNTVLFTRGWW